MVAAPSLENTPVVDNTRLVVPLAQYSSDESRSSSESSSYLASGSSSDSSSAYSDVTSNSNVTKEQLLSPTAVQELKPLLWPSYDVFESESEPLHVLPNTEMEISACAKNAPIDR